MAVASYLAKIGTSDAVEPRTRMDALAADFAFEKIGRAPAHFSLEELAALNGKLLHLLPYEDVRERLQDSSNVDLGAEFWDAVKPNLTHLHQAVETGKARARARSIPSSRSPISRRQKRRSCLPAEPVHGRVVGARGPRPLRRRPAARAGRCIIRCGWR